MSELYIYRDSISASFNHQVLATPNYTTASPLLLIFHDPPEVVGRVHPVSGKLSLHEMSMADVLRTYTAWAIAHSFSVIDVNIPKYLTGITDSGAADSDVEKAKVEQSTNDLAIYLWENYIEPHDTREVVFLGVGDAYRAILHILNTRIWEKVQQFTAVVGFVSENPLRPVTEQFIPDFAKHYNRRSLIFVENKHPVWDEGRAKRPGRKFGRLVKSPANGLNAMMAEHKAEVEAFWREKCKLPFIEEDRVTLLSPGRLGTGAGAGRERAVEEDGDTIMVASRA